MTDSTLPIVREETFGPVQTWANLAIEFEKGGFKASGVGRLGGTASLDDFLEYKQITQNFVPPAHH